MDNIFNYSLKIKIFLLLFYMTTSNVFSQESALITKLEAQIDSLYKEKEFEEALKIADKIIKINPNNPDGWSIKIALLDELNRYEDQIEPYNNLIRLKPDNYIVLINKAFALCMIKKYTESLNTYEETLKRFPKKPVIYLSRGVEKYRMGDYEGALSDFEKSKSYGLDKEQVEYNEKVRVKGIKSVLRILKGSNLPPQSWNPDSYTVAELKRDVTLIDPLLGNEGFLTLKCSGDANDPCLLTFNFYIWQGAAISDSKYGILLENGTKFKYIKVVPPNKTVFIGEIKNWKAQIISEETNPL